MPRYSDLEDHRAVEAALAELERLGRDAFLHRHGFGLAHDYMLATERGRYDSKAIFGVAFGYRNRLVLWITGMHLSAGAGS